MGFNGMYWQLLPSPQYWTSWFYTEFAHMWNHRMGLLFIFGGDEIPIIAFHTIGECPRGRRVSSLPFVFQSPPVAWLLLPCRTRMRLLCLRRRQQHPVSASKFGATRTSTVCAPPWTRHGEGVGEIEGMILPTSSTRSFDRWRRGGSLLVRSFTLGES